MGWVTFGTMTFLCMNVPLVTHLIVFLYYYDCGHLRYLLSDWQGEGDGGCGGVAHEWEGAEVRMMEDR